MTDLSLLEDFIPETIEHLEEMEANLLRLEEDPGDKKTLANIFRSAHTIKGSAEYMGLKRIATIAHRLENLLEIIRQGEKRPDTTLLDTLIESRDRIAALVEDLQNHQEEQAPIDDLVEKIDGITQRYAETPEEPALNEEPDVLGLGDDLEPFGPGDVSDDDESAAQSLAADVEDEISASLGDSLGDLGSEDVLGDTPPGGEAEPALVREAPPAPESAVDAGAQEEGDELYAKALATLTQEESYEEDYDDELFDIFLEHLRENLTEIQAMVNQPGPDPAASMDKFLESVENLRSSASYMDYRRLAGFYENWSAQILEVKERQAGGKPVGFAFMHDYVNQVVERFSHYKDLGIALIEPPETQTPAAKETAPSSMVEQAPEYDQPATGLLLEEDDQTLAASPGGAASAEPSMEEESTQGLFDELDGVFDTSAGSEEEPDLDLDPFADDVEDVLVATDQAPRETKKETKPEKTPEKIKEGKPISGPKPPTPPQQSAPVKPDLSAPLATQDPDSGPVTPEPARPAAQDAPPVAPSLGEGGQATSVQEPGPANELVAEPEKVEAREEEKIQPEKPGGKQEGMAAPERDYSDSSRIAERVVKQSLRVDASKIDTLMNEVGELVVSRASYAQLYNDMREFQQRLQRLGTDAQEMKHVRDLTFRLSEATVALGRVANDLQEGVMKIRMLPIAQLFNRYPRLVRDLVHDTGKKVHLEIKGEDTELDKMVIEEIADPFVHIIRNAVDHGIETIQERKKLGKPEVATVRLDSYHESNHVVVEISDDGKGIDPEAVRRAALKKELVGREELERMRDSDVISLIMLPGFSTSETITKTSGRGVGMDVVKKNVEKLNGTVEVTSEVGQGTRVRIKIPLTLAIIQALLVRVGQEVFTIPLAVVEETLRIRESEISTIEGVEVVQLREGVLSLMRLTDEFDAQSTAPDPTQCYVVVVNTGMRQVGLVVDTLIGQEETVIKPLVDYLQERSGFSGATILGDGTVSLILDVYELVNLSMQRQATRRQSTGMGRSKRLYKRAGDEAGRTLH